MSINSFTYRKIVLITLLTYMIFLPLKAYAVEDKELKIEILTNLNLIESELNLIHEMDLSIYDTPRIRDNKPRQIRHLYSVAILVFSEAQKLRFINGLNITPTPNYIKSLT